MHLDCYFFLLPLDTFQSFKVLRKVTFSEYLSLLLGPIPTHVLAIAIFFLLLACPEDSIRLLP